MKHTGKPPSRCIQFADGSELINSSSGWLIIEAPAPYWSGTKLSARRRATRKKPRSEKA